MDKAVTFTNFKKFFDRLFDYFFTKKLFVKEGIKFNNSEKNFIYVENAEKTIDFSDFKIKQDEDEEEEIIETSIETI